MVAIESVRPDSILATNNNTCFGVAKELTLVGGTLGTGSQWQWYSDTSFTVSEGSGISITVDPDTSTTYYVRAEGGCNNTLPAMIRVTVPAPSSDPDGILIINDNSCPGAEKTLTVDGGSLGDGAEWFWYSDIALTVTEGTGLSIVVDPDSSKTYYVRAEGTCNNTISTAQLVIVKRISEAPANAEADITEYCQGEMENITLSYSGGVLGDGAEAYWYTDPLFEEPSIGTGNDLTISAPVDTTEYFVRIEGDCDTTEAVSVRVYVNPLPVPVISGETEVCTPVQNEYTVHGLSGSYFSWSITGGIILGDASGDTILVSWTGEDQGMVTVTETTTGGCVAVTDADIVLYASPVANEIMGGSTVICSGQTGVPYYIDGYENSLFEWNIQGGTINGDFGDSVLTDWIAPPGSYLINVLEISEHGCSGDTLSLTVQIEGPEIDLGGDNYICEGEVFSIDLSGEYNTYLWHDGTTGSSFTTSEEGKISVRVDDEYGCQDTDSLYLTVNPLPMVDLGSDTTLCGDLGMELDAGPDGIYYDWSTGDNSREITVYMGDKQLISVIVEDEYGCISSDSIEVNECNTEFYFRDIPTAITPNGDGTNDVWNIVKLAGYSGAEVEIFSRWGTLIWKSEPGYSVPWDGRDMHGKTVPMDSYHYVIKLKAGRTDRITGIITVIR